MDFRLYQGIAENLRLRVLERERAKQAVGHLSDTLRTMAIELTTLFKSLADEQRLRILNLLWEGPLCVCHLQSILKEGQVKMSKQLGYMRKNGLVEANREGTWMIYSLVEPIPALLERNIQCLRELMSAEGPWLEDLAARERELKSLRRLEVECPNSVVESLLNEGEQCC